MFVLLVLVAPYVSSVIGSHSVGAFGGGALSLTNVTSAWVLMGLVAVPGGNASDVSYMLWCLDWTSGYASDVSCMLWVFVWLVLQILLHHGRRLAAQMCST